MWSSKQPEMKKKFSVLNKLFNASDNESFIISFVLKIGRYIVENVWKFKIRIF